MPIMVKSAYTKGTTVWLYDLTKVWNAAVVLEDFVDSILYVETLGDISEWRKIPIDADDDLPCLCHSLDYNDANKIWNLTSLNYVNEASILHVLRSRCESRQIFTFCGFSTLLILNLNIELTFLNSFQNIKSMFIEKNKSFYKSPLNQFTRNIYDNLKRKDKNQSVIFSGEPGSGKTTYTVAMLDEFSNVGLKKSSWISDHINAGLVVIQSFCTAKTVINRTSSRFGKLIELLYDRDHQLSGVHFKTYCFDLSRLIFRREDEENFNIFYQLRSEKRMVSFNKTFDIIDFKYLKNYSENKGGTYFKSFKKTVEALITLGFSEVQQTEIFHILCAILYLGNLEFGEKDTKNSYNFKRSYMMNPELLDVVVKFLHLDTNLREDLQYWMCNKKIRVSRLRIVDVAMSREAAMQARDNLAKLLYIKLFKCIISHANWTFTPPPNHLSIFLLDFVGFERTDFNEFEQFCINYAVEKMQQQYIETMFKAKEQEYFKENLKYFNFEYRDNWEEIFFFEKPMGMVEVVEAESRVIQSSLDSKLANNFALNAHKLEMFSEWRTSTERVFRIDHYMDSITYNISSFYKKNNEAVPLKQIELLKKSENNFLKIMITRDLWDDEPDVMESEKKDEKKEKPLKNSILGNLKGSLNRINFLLKKTTPFYVRCIKTNDYKNTEFNSLRVVEQLRSYDIVNTVTIAKASFFDQLSYTEFFLRYHFLNFTSGEPKNTCKSIINEYVQKPFQYYLGDKSVFLQKGAVASLESKREEKIMKFLAPIKKVQYVQREGAQNNTDNDSENEKSLLKKIIIVQKCVRKFLAKKRLQNIFLEKERDILYKVLLSQLRKNILPLVTQVDSIDHMEFASDINELYSKKMQARLKFKFLIEIYFELADRLNEIKHNDPDENKECSDEVEELFRDFEKLTKLQRETQIALDLKKVGNLNLPEEEEKNEVIDLKGTIKVNSVEDISKILNHLFIDEDPLANYEVAPQIGAQIIFMCIRFIDSKNNLEMAQTLIDEYMKRVRGVIERHNQFLSIANWLSNTHSLLNLLKQYSKPGLNEANDVEYNWRNTPVLHEQNLRKLDLRSYWEQLECLGLWIIDKAVRHVTEKIMPFIFPAFFYESVYDDNKTALEMEILRAIEAFNFCDVDKHLSWCILRRIFKFLNDYVVQHFMSNLKVYCAKQEAERLRKTFNHLQDWALKYKVLALMECLSPLREVYRLIQIQPMTADDIEVIASNFRTLSSENILKILESYQPSYNFEKKTPKMLLFKLQLMLEQKQYLEKELLPDTSESKVENNLQLNFIPSDVIFKDLQVPSYLNSMFLEIVKL